MKIVCISDTHRQEHKVKLPKGDILLHAGDFDIYDMTNLHVLNDWFGTLDFKHIVFIAGNHERYLPHFDKKVIKSLFTNAIYLENDSVEIEGIKIFGSPYTPVFGQWSFMEFSDELKKIWGLIPEDTDILLCHGQPFGINDQINGISQGCPHLRDKIKQIKPKYYIGGHLHPNHGIYQDENTTYINCSLLDDFYKMVYEPIIINYEN